MGKTKTVVQRRYTAHQRSQIKKLLGNNLREARKNAGLSQTEVMQIIWGNGKSRNRISEIENGHTEIDIFLLLLLIDLYGQSADYIFGRSCEPINDILATHINNVRLHTKNYLEPVIESMTACVVNHIAKIDKDEHLQLIDTAKQMSAYLMEHGRELKGDYPTLYHLLVKLEQSVRTIGVKEARRLSQMQAQLDDIAHRHDKQSGHLLMSDMHKGVQYSLPFPEPDSCVIEVE